MWISWWSFAGVNLGLQTSDLILSYIIIFVISRCDRYIGAFMGVYDIHTKRVTVTAIPFDAQIVPVFARRTPSSWPLCPCNMIPSVSAHFLVFLVQKMSQVILYLPHPKPGSSCFAKKSGSFGVGGGEYLETKPSVVHMLISGKLSVEADGLRWSGKEP